MKTQVDALLRIISDLFLLCLTRGGCEGSRDDLLSSSAVEVFDWIEGEGEGVGVGVGVGPQNPI
jgi:hypothetical protein